MDPITRSQSIEGEVIALVDHIDIKFMSKKAALDRDSSSWMAAAVEKKKVNKDSIKNKLIYTYKEALDGAQGSKTAKSCDKATQADI